MTRLRVLHATPSYAPAYRFGGPVQSLEGLVGALSHCGVRVRVVTTDTGGDKRLDVPTCWTERDGIPVRYLRGLQGDIALRTFDVVLREALQADVVHVTAVFNVPSVLSLAAALAARKPIVLSPRGVFEAVALRSRRYELKRAWLTAIRPLLDRVDSFHVTSESEADSVRREIRNARLAVVPNGTTLPDLRGGGAVDGTPRVVALGRIHPIKGLDRLIRAGAILAERGHSHEIVIAGPAEDSAHFQELQQLARSAGIAGRVEFRGEVRGDQKAALLRESRVLALPSHSENFGNVVIEALSYGVPVVAAHGTPWRILDEVGAGRWIPNEPLALADAIEDYLLDSARSAADGRRGRELVRTRYSWESVAARMKELYRTLASQKP